MTMRGPALRRSRSALVALLFSMTTLAANPPGAMAQGAIGIRVMVVAEGTGRAADADSLAAALAASPRLDAVLIAPTGTALVDAAARASCSLAVGVTSETLPSGDARSVWLVADPLTGKTLAEGVVEGPEPTDRDMAEFWWIPVVDAAEASLSLVAVTRVRVTGRPGTRILGLGDTALTIPEGGSEDIALRIPGTYPWRAVSKGAYPSRGTFGALEQGASLFVPDTPLERWTLEAGLFMGQFLDIWASWRFAEDYLFIRAGLTQFLAGLYLVDASMADPAPATMLGLPLAQPGIGLGAYALAPDYAVRPYATATAFARIVGIGGIRSFVDPVAPVGATAALGAEWRAQRRVGVFMELGAAWYPFCDGPLMAASRSSGDTGATGFSFGADWFLEYPLLRIGARFYL